MDRINQRPTRYTAADYMRMRAADEVHAANLRRQRIKHFIYGTTWSVTGAAVILYILAHI